MAVITQEQAETAVTDYLNSIGKSIEPNSTIYNEESHSYSVRVFDGSNRYDIVIPDSTENIQTAFSYVGPNRESNDYSRTYETVVESATSNNNLNMVCVMSDGNYDGFRSLEMATDIAGSFGCTPDTVMASTFSAGDYYAAERLNEYSANHPDTQVYYLNNEGINYQLWHEGSTDNMVANGNVTVYYTGERFKSADDIMARKFSKLGLTTYVIEPSGTNAEGNDCTIHSYLTKAVFNDGFVDYLLGISDTHKTSCNYKYYEVNGLAENGLEYSELTEEELYSKIIGNDRLLNLTFKDRSDLASGNTGTLVSDLYAVCYSMNELGSNICGYNTNTLPSFESTTSIPASINNCENSFLSISQGVLGNLNKETELIKNAAQCIYDMDNDLANRAYSLSDGSNLFGGVSSASQLATYLQNYTMSSDLKITSFMFDPQSHKEGNTGSINKSELENIISQNSPLRQNLTDEINSSKEIKSYIQNFNDIKNQGRIVGEVWNVISNKLSEYDILMDKRIEYATKLDATIVSAVKSIIDYMGDYDALDDTKLEQERENEKRLVASIAEATNKINATKLVASYSTDKKGRTIFAGLTRVYVYDEATRSAAKALLEEYSKQLVETRKLIAKLENLWQIIAKAEQEINNVLSEMYSDYATEANNIIVGSASTYEPPSNTEFNYVEPVEKTYDDIETSTPWYKVSEENFNKNASLKGRFDSYEDYLNGVTNKVNDAHIIDSVSEEEFNSNSELQKEYGDYTKYLMRDENIEGSSKKIYVDGTDESSLKNEDALVDQTASQDTSNLQTTSASTDNKVSEGEFNRSTAMQEKYGSYQNYLEGKEATIETTSSISDSNLSQVNTSELAKDYYSNPSRGHNDNSSAPSTDAPSAPSTDTPNVPVAETPSEPVTETPSEPVTETPDVSTKEPVAVVDKPVENKVVNNNKPNVNYNTKNETPIVNNPVENVPITEEPVIDTPVIEEPVVEEPIIDIPVIEEPVVEEPVVQTPVVDVPFGEKTTNNSSDTASKIAIAAGVATALGGAAYGAYKYNKSKKYEYDYDYEKDEDNEDNEEDNK